MRRAEIFKTRKLPLWQRPVEYRFRLIGDNGEIIAQSEGYTQKHNAWEVLKKYFPEWTDDAYSVNDD